MKGIFEEYGKLVVTVMVLAVMIGFVFYTGNGGAVSLFGKVRPEATVSQDNAHDKLATYNSRGKPVIEVKTEKLSAGTEYNLLAFVTKAESEDGDTTGISVDVKRITDPFGNNMTVPEKAGGKVMFTFPAYDTGEAGDYDVSYRVTYEVTDSKYADFPVTSEKTYQFIVN
ncbi:MAG: hypothetical protein ACI4KE_07635 [Anaerovoracaceae bacterium]